MNIIAATQLRIPHPPQTHLTSNSEKNSRVVLIIAIKDEPEQPSPIKPESKHEDLIPKYRELIAREGEIYCIRNF